MENNINRQPNKYAEPSKITAIVIAIAVAVIIFMSCCCSSLMLIIFFNKDNISLLNRSKCASMKDFIDIANKENIEIYSQDETSIFNSVHLCDGYAYIDFYYYDPYIYEGVALEEFKYYTQDAIYDSDSRLIKHGNLINCTYEKDGVYFNVSINDNCVMLGRTYKKEYIDELDLTMKKFGY